MNLLAAAFDSDAVEGVGIALDGFFTRLLRDERRLDRFAEAADTAPLQFRYHGVDEILV